ncbi:MAG: hypothetical protein V3S87_07940, partial [Alphaproteobacteria bacterium]
ASAAAPSVTWLNAIIVKALPLLGAAPRSAPGAASSLSGYDNDLGPARPPRRPETMGPGKGPVPFLPRFALY